MIIGCLYRYLGYSFAFCHGGNKLAIMYLSLSYRTITLMLRVRKYKEFLYNTRRMSNTAGE